MKKYVYVFLWIVLGYVLGMNLIAAAQLGCSQGAQSLPSVDPFFGDQYCAFPSGAEMLFLVLVIFAAFFSGLYFWKVVYVEKRRWRQGGTEKK